MWKPDVQGRGKIQKAFRNGESNNSASELELVLSTMGPGDRQGAVGLCVGVRNKARLHFRHRMGLCSNTAGGKGGEPELVVGPHFRCSQPCPSTATLLVLTSLIPGTSRGTASTAAALGSVLHPADLTSVTMLWVFLCGNSSCNTTARPASGVPHHPTQDLSCDTTTHEQAVGCCFNMLCLKSS